MIARAGITVVVDRKPNVTASTKSYLFAANSPVSLFEVTVIHLRLLRCSSIPVSRVYPRLRTQRTRAAGTEDPFVPMPDVSFSSMQLYAEFFTPLIWLIIFYF